MPTGLVSQSAYRPQTLFTDSDFSQQRAFFEARPALRPTPLHRCPALASQLGLGQLLVKDETGRFGLNAFKIAGALFAMATLRERGELREGAVAVCASEGNHGRAVAHAARGARCTAKVYMSNQVAAARIEAIREEGAEVVLVDGSYDEAVRVMAKDADASGWTVISDTSWPGYREIPRLIMLGYTRILDEIAAQIDEPRLGRDPDSRPAGGTAPDQRSRSSSGAGPDLRSSSGAEPDLRSSSGAGLQPGHTVIFVPAGVGGLLAAAACWADRQFTATRPRVVAVEPVGAACVQASMREGRPTSLPGPFDTAMGGLRCGVMSPAVFPDIEALVDACVAIEDDYAFDAMRVLADPSSPDPRIACGPSGAAALGGLLATLRSPALNDVREHLRLDQAGRVVVLVTEGVTDPVLYNQVVARH